MKKNPIFGSINQKVSRLQKESPLFSLELPDDLLPEKLDLEDSNTYKYLFSLLEKPWLGEKIHPDCFHRGK